MTANIAEAYDLMMARFRTAWLASGVTQNILVEWDDVRNERAKHDSNGKPLPWVRVTIRHLSSGQESQGGPGVQKYENLGTMRVQIFTPPGTGRVLARQIQNVVQVAFRGKADGDLWYFDVTPGEGLPEGAWTVSRVDVSFRYIETV